MGALNENLSDVNVPSPADPGELRFSARAMPAWHQAEKGCKVPSILERFYNQ